MVEKAFARSNRVFLQGQQPANDPQDFSRAVSIIDPITAQGTFQVLVQLGGKSPSPDLSGCKNIQRATRHNPRVAELKAEDFVDQRIDRKLEGNQSIERL